MNAPARELLAQPDDSAAVAISVCDVRKAYRTYDQPLSFLVEVATGRKKHREKEVLRDISLEIKRGEVVGIIGRNGAGKSTLLKMIAGTLAPTSGRIDVTGRVSAILELGTGFNSAYSGRDNVIMSGLMRGMSEEEVRKKFDAVVAFAGLEDVIDQPFHTYSSGMQARLAFAAAVSVDADVIIIDEALAAGDVRFTARSLGRIREICKSGVTALFVSHQTYQVMQLCSRAIWLDDGRIRLDGPSLEVCRAYEYEMHEAVARDEGRLSRVHPTVIATVAAHGPDTPVDLDDGHDTTIRASLNAQTVQSEPEAAPENQQSIASPAMAVMRERGTLDEAASHFSTNTYRITKVNFLDGAGNETNRFRFWEPLTLRVEYECLVEAVPDVSCGLAVAVTSVSEHIAVMYFNTNYPHTDQEMHEYDRQLFRQYIGRAGVIEARIPFLQLKAGEYLVSLGLLPNSKVVHEFYEYRHMAYLITVLPNGYPEPSIFYPQVEWTNRPI